METKTLYLVSRHGAYLQGIFGIFSTVEKAKACINGLLNIPNEDSYHTYSITRFELDVDIDLDNSAWEYSGTPVFDWEDFNSRIIFSKTKDDMEMRNV